MNLMIMLMMMFMLMLNLDLDNPQSKNQRYDKRHFVARKHCKEREPWVQNPCPFHPNQLRREMMKSLNALLKWLGQFFRTRLTDILKMAPYAKYMKDIITNKRKIPKVEISSMLPNYSFKDGVPKNMEIQEYQLYLAPSKEIISKPLCVI